MSSPFFYPQTLTNFKIYSTIKRKGYSGGKGELLATTCFHKVQINVKRNLKNSNIVRTIKDF
jgi:hypothetical protein